MTTLNPRGAQPPFNVNMLTDYQARPLGASQAGSTAVSTSAVELLAVASNVNGVILRSRSLVANGASVALKVGTSAPANMADMAKPIVAMTLDGDHWDAPLHIPAGYGVWAVASSGSGHYAAINYDLL